MCFGFSTANARSGLIRAPSRAIWSWPRTSACYSPATMSGPLPHGESSPESRPFSWSASRHDTFATCRRRYYYSYYASLEDEAVRRL